MTKGLIRYQQTGDLHFVTFSCYQRRPYLASAESKEIFELALERMCERYKFLVIGYVVVPEHVHLLIGEPDLAPLETSLQALKLSVTVRRPERPFWQARYYDFNVFSEKKQIEKLRYMHRNPVTRGLAAKPEDWPWSSFRHYATGENQSIEIESFWTAARRSQEKQTHVSEARHGAPASIDCRT